ncbi:unnamed protein product [Nezara viridula]|uniref:Uncharacterized protein n=1 Tax=Nezara viridula TaxID=85310 RepID=A0A9P0HSH2_NEZVI|nr:unnamed protein product [Nezara viridula]
MCRCLVNRGSGRSKNRSTSPSQCLGPLVSLSEDLRASGLWQDVLEIVRPLS